MFKNILYLGLLTTMCFAIYFATILPMVKFLQAVE